MSISTFYIIGLLLNRVPRIKYELCVWPIISCLPPLAPWACHRLSETSSAAAQKAELPALWPADFGPSFMFHPVITNSKSLLSTQPCHAISPYASNFRSFNVVYHQFPLDNSWHITDIDPSPHQKFPESPRSAPQARACGALFHAVPGPTSWTR